MATLLLILKNEKYMGDALLQKTYTVDLLEKKRAANHGEVPQYYVKHSHEAIIPEQVFLEVKAEIARRSALKKESNGRRCYTYKNALTSVLIYSNASKESLIVRVEHFIEDDDWNFADIYSNQVLDINLKNGYVYYLRILLENEVKISHDLIF